MPWPSELLHKTPEQYFLSAQELSDLLLYSESSCLYYNNTNTNTLTAALDRILQTLIYLFCLLYVGTSFCVRSCGLVLIVALWKRVLAGKDFVAARPVSVMHI